MACNLKSVGLALIAVLAMSALAASAAQANPEYTSSTYPATATGSNTAGNETLTTVGGSVQCDADYLVEEYGGGYIVEASDILTVSFTYTNCVAFGFLSATINSNGCTFTYHATEKVSATEYLNHTDIDCPSGNSIKITAGTCEVALPDQNGLTTVSTTNLAGGTVTVEPELSGITLNTLKDGFACPLTGTGHSKASYHGDIVISRIGGGSVSVSGE